MERGHSIMKGWNSKKYAAVCLSSGMMLAALAFAQGGQDVALAAEQTQTEEEVSLMIAGTDETEAEDMDADRAENGVKLSLTDDKTEAQTEAETETEASETEAATEELPKASADAAETLETTVTGNDGIVAMDVSGIVENCMPSIVAITNKSVQEVENYYYGTQEVESMSAGSGIIIAQSDTELMIATNKHVVEDAQEMTVCFSVDADDPEDAIVSAVTKGTDAQYDLAVVAVKLSDIPDNVLSQLKIATLGSSANLKVGETAIVIGNALGTGQTVTCGIISALEREITTDVGTFTELQTDAAINLGCSGGALLNKRGEVIGISSAKATGDYAESMGYAIPIDTAIPVLSKLINRQTREKVDNHGYMGITVVPVSSEAEQMYNMPAGAFVYEVSEGSAGEAAGLKKGDIITSFDGISIDSSETLVETLSYYNVGETVTLEVQDAQNGAYVSREVQVTLQQGVSDVSAAGQDGDQGSQGPAPYMDNDENDQYGLYPDEEYGMDGGSDESMMEQFYNYFFGEDGNGNGDNFNFNPFEGGQPNVQSNPGL